jgi:acyl transferase domain-containing protein
VIAEALAVAGVEPETITYVEAHGTGTALGDPIEIAALTRAFRARTTAKRFCAIGSVKTNIGHLDAAAGITGIIKTVLALQHRQIPPSLHFEQPNPNIDFADGPFYVNTALNEWNPIQHLRRAGVSSFGFGGTNAHVVLEEAPQREPSGPSRPWQLLVLSAKTPSALETATANLTAHLKTHPELTLADVAYTLQTGRRAFSYRRMLICRDLDDAVRTLEPPISMRVPTRWLDSVQESRQRSVVFMFPGQGTQYGQMARELYDKESFFREQVDACAARGRSAKEIANHLGVSVKTVGSYDARIKEKLGFENAGELMREAVLWQDRQRGL